MKGRKPRPRYLRLIDGNRGRRPLPRPDPLPAGSIEKPAKLTKAAAILWDRYVTRAVWLTWADSPKAAMWCELQSQFERRPSKMLASKIAQLRAVGSELGFDPATRARLDLGIIGQLPPENPADKYLG
jgi:hypothetical protein